MAAPILREPPVTSAILPASFFVMFVLIIVSIQPRLFLGYRQVRARLGANGRDHIHVQLPRSAKFRRRAWRFRSANPATSERRWGCLFSFAFRSSLFNLFYCPVTRTILKRASFRIMRA